LHYAQQAHTVKIACWTGGGSPTRKRQGSAQSRETAQNAAKFRVCPEH
jgi:hypothetical protein